MISKWITKDIHKEFIRSIWCSHKDFNEICYRAISKEKFADKYNLGKGIFAITYAVSDNSRNIYDISCIKELLDYFPVDNIDNIIGDKWDTLNLEE